MKDLLTQLKRFGKYTCAKGEFANFLANLLYLQMYFLLFCFIAKQMLCTRAATSRVENSAQVLSC